jgi:hypothetical protein
VVDVERFISVMNEFDLVKNGDNGKTSMKYTYNMLALDTT